MAYNKIINFFLENWIIAVLVLIASVIAFLPKLKDGVVLIKNIWQKIFSSSSKNTPSSQYTPCSPWDMERGDRVRHINESEFERYGILTIENVKGDYVLCYIGDPYNMKIKLFKISELTKEGIQ